MSIGGDPRTSPDLAVPRRARPVWSRAVWRGQAITVSAYRRRSTSYRRRGGRVRGRAQFRRRASAGESGCIVTVRPTDCLTHVRMGLRGQPESAPSVCVRPVLSAGRWRAAPEVEADGLGAVFEHLALVVADRAEEIAVAGAAAAEQVGVAQAVLAPLPPVGEVAWMASPSSVTGQGDQRSPGSTTRMESRVLLSGSACSISARRSGPARHPGQHGLLWGRGAE